ncbi:MAG: hypothetical protein ACTS3F_01010 [Phycisphaerales bacterium]
MARRSSTSPLAHARAALADRSRRGVVIILALAVLAIISLAALSYMTVVRSDRVSSVVVAERAGFERQPQAVIDEIGALLTADLFGQKVVTQDVPRNIRIFGSTYPNWPRPFEDNESWDYPHADTWFLADSNNARVLTADEDNPEDRIAQPDDAWLASTEPLWDITANLGNLDRTKVWLQVSNINSGYRWDPNEGANGAWVRRDGKFVDLGQYFSKAIEPDANPGVFFGNPRVDFLGDPSTPEADRGLAIGPEAGVFYKPGTGDSALYNNNNPLSNNSLNSTVVFDLPLSEMTLIGDNDFDTGPGVLDHADTRLWVDTDGDIRPDARWTQIDALGSLAGLDWFVAARIIDASGLLNYNTALEFSYAGQNLAAGPTNKLPGTFLDLDPRTSNGLTPADVDFFGLIYEMTGGDNQVLNNIFDLGPTPPTKRIPVRNDLFTFPGDPETAGITGIDAFEDHLYNGLGLSAFYASADNAADALLNPAAVDPPFDAPTVFNPGSAGFGQNTWRTHDEGLPARSGLLTIPNYTQLIQPTFGLPDHATAVAAFGGNFTTTLSNTPTNPTLTQSQRRAFYEWGILPGDRSPLTPPRRYPVSDLIDLRAFWGTNSDALSAIEKRIDGPEGIETTGGATAYLPGGDISDNGYSYGPVRSRQPSLTARLATTDGSQARARPTSEQIYHDTRRLLTPHSGAAPFSSVPITNPLHPAYRNPQIRTKPLISRPLTTNKQTEELFNAFVWALAPQIARLSNTAVSQNDVPQAWRGDATVPYLDDGAPILTADPQAHYGGGILDEIDATNLPGPATRLWNNGNGFVNQPVGASYAIRAALALTANTIAASRSDDPNAKPLIVRFYPQGVSLPPGEGTPDEAIAAGQIQREAFTNAATGETIPVEVLTGRLTYGDLPQQFPNDQTLPQFYLGNANAGITVVPFTRQPFLIGAYSLAVYENDEGVELNTDGSANIAIDPQLPQNRFGSIFAVEIGNPFDTTINLDDIEIQIQVAKQISGGATRLRMSLVGQNILPGARAIFYVQTDPANFANASPRAAATMDEVRTDWLAAIAAQPDAPTPVRLADNPTTIRIESPAGDPNDPILFNRLSLEEIRQIPVLLVRRIDGAEILIDRMLPNFSAGFGGNDVPFPAAYPLAGAPTDQMRFSKGADLGGGNFSNTYVFARATVESEVRRPTINAQQEGAGNPVGGFPAYVIERPQQNDLRSDAITTTTFNQSLTSNFASPSPEQFPVDPADTLLPDPGVFSNNPGAIRLGATPQNTNPADTLNNETNTLTFAEPFELFVPRGPILNKADLLRLTAFAHIYRPSGPPTPGLNATRALAVTEGNALFSSFLLNDQPANGIIGIAPGIDVPTTPYWLTVSEQLGLSANLFLGQATPPSNPIAPVAFNPYFNVINPLRDHRDAATDLSNTRIADILTIPPAARLIDTVEVFDSAATRIDGRININTAPDQVLKSLPMAMPRRDIAGYNQAPFGTGNAGLPSPLGSNPSGLDWLRAYDRTRIESLTTYRDRRGRASSPLPNLLAPNALVGLTSGATLRQPGGQRNDQPRGVISIGELPLMHRWNVVSGAGALGEPSPYFQPSNAAAVFEAGFAQLGADNQRNAGPPFEFRSYEPIISAGALRSFFGSPLTADTANGIPAGVDHGADGHEERLAIFRAMANIVETRSDVFLATFVVRAYRPSVVASIRVNDPDDDEDVSIAMNSDAFTPEYESRWLVLFDRSNVRQPTDRPRVLLKAELPPTGN